MSQIFCPKHEEMEIRAIDFTDGKPLFLCEECISNNQFQSKSVNLDAFLYLYKLIDPKTLKAKSNPEYIISKMNVFDLQPLFNHLCLYDANVLTQQWKVLDGRIEEMLITLQKLRQEFEMHINQIIKNKQILQEKLNKIIQFEEFVQILEELNNQTSSGDTQKQIEQRFFSYFKNLRKFYRILNIRNALMEAYNKQQLQACNLSVPNFKLLKNQFKTFNSFADNYLKLGLPNPLPNLNGIILSAITSLDQTCLLLHEISKQTKRVISAMEPLEPNHHQHYNFRHQSNLLFIMKQKNTKFVFGGFSCCQWGEKSRSYFVQDDERTSFIFYQKKQEKMKFIYQKQNEENYAICCDGGWGPIFGLQDLKVSSDFSKAFWNTNGSYDFQEHQLLNEEEEMIIDSTSVYKIDFAD